MNKSMALFWSVVGHPIFVNCFSLWLLFALFPQLGYGIHPSVQWFYIGFISFTTGVIPMLWVLIAIYFTKSTTIMLPEKEDRNQPYLITSALYLFNFYLSKRVGAPILLSAYLLGCSAVVVTVLITNLFTKISIHGASLGALLGVAIAAVPATSSDLRPVIAALFLFSGLVLASRLFLASHTPSQVVSGFLTGLMLMILML